MIRTRDLTRRTRLVVLTSSATVALAVGACGSPESGDLATNESFTVRDSAGIEIVENRRPAWPAGREWWLDSVPETRIGRQQGEAAYEFAGVAGAVALPGGGIAVADEGSGQIRVFDPAGKIERIVGSRGQGPGEFTTLAGLGLTTGGRLWAYDFALRRVSWIDPAGGTIESRSLGPEPPVLAAAGPLPAAAFALRQLWGASGVARANRSGVRRDSALVVVFDSAGTLTDTVGAFPGREVVISIENGRGVMTTRPFGADLVAVTRDSSVVVGQQNVPVVEEYSAEGALRRRIMLPEGADREVDEDEIESFVTARLVDVPEEARPAVRSDLRSLPFPERRPAYGRMLADGAGNLWIGEWTPDAQTARRWSVFDGRGVWLGNIVLPAGFRLLSVGNERLVGVERDALDTEHIAVYRLKKP